MRTYPVACNDPEYHALTLHVHGCRGDLVSIETWFQSQGRMAAARNWIIRKAKTGQVIGRGTRYTECLRH